MRGIYRAYTPRYGGCMVACVARNCYEELQVVTAQLPENESCVALPVLGARQATQDKSVRYVSDSGHFQKPGFRHTQFSEIDLPEYLLRRWRAYADSHFKSAAPTTSPKTKARTAYTVSPKRNATNVVTKETIKPKKSTLHQAPLADACTNSLSFSCFSCLLLARALSLLDTLLDDPLRTLMLTTSLRGLGSKRPAPDGPWPVWQLRSAPYCRTELCPSSPSFF